MSRTYTHYTCPHGAALIRAADMTVRPNRHPMLGNIALSWWTVNPHADRLALGLSSRLLSCDRMEYRFEALAPIGFVSWAGWRQLHGGTVGSALEHPPADPSIWAVSEIPIRVKEVTR